MRREQSHATRCSWGSQQVTRTTEESWESGVRFFTNVCAFWGPGGPRRCSSCRGWAESLRSHPGGDCPWRCLPEASKAQSTSSLELEGPRLVTSTRLQKRQRQPTWTAKVRPGFGTVSGSRPFLKVALGILLNVSVLGFLIGKIRMIIVPPSRGCWGLNEQ